MRNSKVVRPQEKDYKLPAGPVRSLVFIQSVSLSDSNDFLDTALDVGIFVG